MSSFIAPQEITLEAYLHRDYENERECEFIDGRLEERTGGGMEHGRLHAAAASWFAEHRDAWHIDPLMSYSMWASPTRIRIPDIVVLKDKLRENIRITPPFFCVEILSPEDTPTRLLRRLEDILNMGCEHVWLLDPAARAALTCTRNGLRLAAGPALTIPGSPIHIDIAELFSALD